MADWLITRPIDYSPSGDDVDSFSQKVKYTLEQIYECLQILRGNGAQAGLTGAATPFEIRIDTTTGYIYMRNADNTDWILLGEVGEHFGLTPEKISAVRNGGGLGKISCGRDIDKPLTGNESRDIYLAEDTSIAYMWTGMEWKKFLSLNFEDMLNYERFCVARSELTQLGGVSSAGKIVQLDSRTGKANVDIAGSPDMLWGYFIDFQDLKDDDVITFDAGKRKFVNKRGAAQGSSSGSSAGVDDSAINYLKRLVGELHLALMTANLDTTGYDSMLTEVFYSNNESIDTTEVNVTSIIMGSNSLMVNSLDGLIVGANYQLVDANYLQDVRISELKNDNNRNYVTLAENVRYPFTGTTKLRRSNGTFNEGYITGDGVSFVTNPVSFVNEATGEGKNISIAHLNVKHQNVEGAEISAEIALINNPAFVSGEVIGIGSDTTQQVTLANTENLSSYGFKLFFNGVEQTSGYTFSPSDGKVTFNAGGGVIVQANYFYNWSEESFVPFEKSGVFCDKKNNTRATTQFVYQAANTSRTGSVAVIRLSLSQAAGGETNRVLGTSTGNPQAFKLPHHAVASSIQVLPASATWSWNNDLDVLIVTVARGQEISVSYDYKAKPFRVDSFAVMFNE